MHRYLGLRALRRARLGRRWKPSKEWKGRGEGEPKGFKLGKIFPCNLNSLIVELCVCNGWRSSAGRASDL